MWVHPIHSRKGGVTASSSSTGCTQWLLPKDKVTHQWRSAMARCQPVARVSIRNAKPRDGINLGTRQWQWWFIPVIFLLQCSLKKSISGITTEAWSTKLFLKAVKVIGDVKCLRNCHGHRNLGKCDNFLWRRASGENQDVWMKRELQLIIYQYRFPGG